MHDANNGAALIAPRVHGNRAPNLLVVVDAPQALVSHRLACQRTLHIGHEGGHVRAGVHIVYRHAYHFLPRQIEGLSEPGIHVLKFQIAVNHRDGRPQAGIYQAQYLRAR